VTTCPWARRVPEGLRTVCLRGVCSHEREGRGPGQVCKWDECRGLAQSGRPGWIRDGGGKCISYVEGTRTASAQV
jgi:hypothetical protein